MVTWRNRSIDTLSASELRRALDDALDEVTWSRAAPDPSSFFSALLLGFSAGAVVGAAAVLTFAVLA
jgi:hypothetical protein